MTEHSVGTVGVLDKTVQILDALEGGGKGIGELSRLTGMPRPTVHRLCVALEHHGLLARRGDDRVIGPRLKRWAGETASFEHRLIEAAVPVLERLRDDTQESVQLYVREGNQRRCIAGLESPHGLRTIVRVGTTLALNVGSAGAVLRSHDTEWKQSVEEREKGVASVSAPVVIDGEVVAAVSVSGPIDRTTREPGALYATAVMRAAGSIGRSLSSAVEKRQA